MHIITIRRIMKTLLYLLPLWLTIVPSSVYQPEENLKKNTYKINRSFFRIGDQLIKLEKYGDARNQNYILVSLHENESRYEAAQQMVHQNGITWLRAIYENGNIVKADLFNKKIVFDPQHIFTSWGRRVHLKENGCWSKAGDEYVQQFARFVLNEIPHDKTVVTFLNEKILLSEFMAGGSREKEAKLIHRNESMPENIFFLTPDEDVYSELKSRNHNVVFQHGKKIEDNGTLIVYSAKVNKPYLSIVAGEPGKELELLEIAHEILQ